MTNPPPKARELAAPDSVDRLTTAQLETLAGEYQNVYMDIGFGLRIEYGSIFRALIRARATVAAEAVGARCGTCGGDGRVPVPMATLDGSDTGDTEACPSCAPPGERASFVERRVRQTEPEYDGRYDRESSCGGGSMLSNGDERKGERRVRLSLRRTINSLRREVRMDMPSAWIDDLTLAVRREPMDWEAGVYEDQAWQEAGVSNGIGLPAVHAHRIRRESESHAEYRKRRVRAIVEAALRAQLDEAQSALWRVAPNTHTIVALGSHPDPFEGPGETYRAAYERVLNDCERQASDIADRLRAPQVGREELERLAADWVARAKPTTQYAEGVNDGFARASRDLLAALAALAAPSTRDDQIYAIVTCAHCGTTVMSSHQNPKPDGELAVSIAECPDCPADGEPR